MVTNEQVRLIRKFSKLDFVQNEEVSRDITLVL